MRSRPEFEQLVESMKQQQSSAAVTNQNQVNFVACLTNLFKDIVIAIEENNETLRINLCGKDGIMYAICELQDECDSRGPDPREIELGFSLVNLELLSRATRAFRSENFSKVVQDITGYYVILKGFFMVENVRKAISIDEHVLDSLTMSMVDDVFYVLQSCYRRSISTSNINSVIAVLSSAVSLLSGEYNEALEQKMREPNLGAKLFMGGASVQRTGTEIAIALNNVDVSSYYTLKLRHKIEEQCSEVNGNCTSLLVTSIQSPSFLRIFFVLALCLGRALHSKFHFLKEYTKITGSYIT
ncbi:unnamed protein product [Ilex paraguariensis]|uniref:COG4 transport protein middle alpha-helical bundle domain-containing protein n=1 Tax=Ilex paraguariensis TaxID=185542 RepID=A0ABC8RUV3_9AQUA